MKFLQIIYCDGGTWNYLSDESPKTLSPSIAFYRGVFFVINALINVWKTTQSKHHQSGLWHLICCWTYQTHHSQWERIGQQSRRCLLPMGWWDAAKNSRLFWAFSLFWFGLWDLTRPTAWTCAALFWSGAIEGSMVRERWINLTAESIEKISGDRKLLDRAAGAKQIRVLFQMI